MESPKNSGQKLNKNNINAVFAIIDNTYPTIFSSEYRKLSDLLLEEYLEELGEDVVYLQSLDGVKYATDLHIIGINNKIHNRGISIGGKKIPTTSNIGELYIDIIKYPEIKSEFDRLYDLERTNKAAKSPFKDMNLTNKNFTQIVNEYGEILDTLPIIKAAGGTFEFLKSLKSARQQRFENRPVKQVYELGEEELIRITAYGGGHYKNIPNIELADDADEIITFDHLVNTIQNNREKLKRHFANPDVVNELIESYKVYRKDIYDLIDRNPDYKHFFHKKNGIYVSNYKEMVTLNSDQFVYGDGHILSLPLSLHEKLGAYIWFSYADSYIKKNRNFALNYDTKFSKRTLYRVCKTLYVLYQTALTLN